MWFVPLFFGGLWLASVARFDLFQPSNFGLPNADRISKTLDALPVALSLASWSGFSWLLLLLPVLVWLPSTRWLMWLGLLQTAFYFATYFGGDQGTFFWVVSSLPRLVFHVMPLLLVAIFVAFGAEARQSNVENRIECSGDQ